MEVSKAFTFFRQEEGWIGKLAIAGLCIFFAWLIVPIFLVIGYQMAIMRNVIDNEETILPDWSDLGALLKDGFYLSVASIVYYSPILLLVLCGSGLALILLPSASDQGAVTAMSALSIALTCLIMPLAVILMFISPPAVFIQYARTGDFGSLFRIGEVIAVARRHVKDIFITILAAIGASLILSLTTILLFWTICLPIVIIYAGSAWVRIGTAHLYGQIAVQGKDKAAALLEANG